MNTFKYVQLSLISPEILVLLNQKVHPAQIINDASYKRDNCFQFVTITNAYLKKIATK